MLSVSGLLCFFLVVCGGVRGQQAGPQQVHLSLTGKEGELSVQWVTFDTPLRPIVLCGDNSSSLSWCADASFNYYPEITGWKGYIHTAILSNLTPKKLYYYQVGDKDGGYSQVFSFRGPRYPVCGGDEQEINVAVFGDMDISSDSDDTVSRMTKHRDEFDFFLHMGDIAYTSTNSHIAVNDTRLDEFFGKIEPIAAYVPYLVSPGNQEQYYRFWQHQHRWYTPPGPNGVTNLWYSFNYGCAHFVSISTEHDLSPNSKQYQWLESDLEQANIERESVPFVIVYGHRPLYCTNSPLDSGYFEDCFLTGPAMRVNIEKLFRKNTVDLFMSGHMHGAEVMYPLKNEKVQQNNWIDPPADSITQVISGYAGCREYFNRFNDNFTKDWTAWRDAEHYGFSSLTITNSSFLDMEYYFNDILEPQFSVIFTRGPKRQGTKGNEEEKEDENQDEGNMGDPIIPEDVLQTLPFDVGFLSDLLANTNLNDINNNINNNILSNNNIISNGFVINQNVDFLFSLPSSLTEFGVGFFIGIGDIYGNIHSDIANWEIGISYDIFWNKLLWENYFSNPTQQNKLDAWQMTETFFSDLETLVHESGGLQGAHDFVDLIAFERKNGLDAFIALELAKFAAHEKNIRKWKGNGDIFLQQGQYKSAGVEYGKCFGVLMKPLV